MTCSLFLLTRCRSAKDHHHPPYKLQNGETVSNSVSNSGSERGADNKSSGYCSSNLYSSGSVEEPIYSEPLVTEPIVPRIVNDHVIDVEPIEDDEDDDDEDEGLDLESSGHKTTISSGGSKQVPPQMRVMGSTNSHSSNYSDNIIITDVGGHVEGDDYERGVAAQSYESPLVQRSDANLSKRLPRPGKVYSVNGKKIPTQQQLHPAMHHQGDRGADVRGLVANNNGQLARYSLPSPPVVEAVATNENGLRRSRKLPTIMEGIDGQIPRPIWPCDMDDSLMDINFESFLYSNEKRESGGQKQQPPLANQPHSPSRRRRCDSPIFNGDLRGPRPNDIENNYRCMKYLDSCSDNPYLVEGVEDLQMSVDKSLALYLKKCDDSLTMQNTRDFLEDIRSKLNGLLENHARHSRVQMRATKMESLVYQKSVALIERQIEKLKYDLDSYLRLFNQSNEQQIKQLCTGLAKDARVQTLQNAIENRRNSLALSSSSLSLLHDATFASSGPVNRLLPATNDEYLGGSAGGDAAYDSGELMNKYDTMRDHWQHQQPQNVFNVISQYPENDLSSYFDTVYVQDGFNMGYKVNSHNNLGRGSIGDPNNFDGKSVALSPFASVHNNIHGVNKNKGNNNINHVLGRSDDKSPVLSATMAKQKRAPNDSNHNSIASSADPNFRLKRNPSLSLSIASHAYSEDRHPILASRDYEKHVEVTVTTDDSLDGSHDYHPDTDSLESHKNRRDDSAVSKDGQRVQNMIMADQGHFNAATSSGLGNLQEVRKSIGSLEREDLIQDWHKNRPSIWELYYGINRPKQSMMSKKSSSCGAAMTPVVVKSGKKKAVIPYVSITNMFAPIPLYVYHPKRRRCGLMASAELGYCSWRRNALKNFARRNNKQKTSFFENDLVKYVATEN